VGAEVASAGEQAASRIMSNTQYANLDMSTSNNMMLVSPIIPDSKTNQ
jgi:hypothetical protein